MTALIVAAAITVYAATWLLSARYWYGRIRPWSEPLSCDSPVWCAEIGYHHDRCYRRWGMVDTVGEAVAGAAAFGMLGPLALAGVAAAAIGRKAITAAARPLPAEVAAKTARIERELGIRKNQPGKEPQ